jgi:hypothetical protein
LASVTVRTLVPDGSRSGKHNHFAARTKPILGRQSTAPIARRGAEFSESVTASSDAIGTNDANGGDTSRPG